MTTTTQVPVPQSYWLTHNYTDKAKFHTDTGCAGLEWARLQAEKQDIDVVDLLAEFPADVVDERTDPRLLCRICALENATIRLLSAPDADGRDVTVTVAAAAVGKQPSDTAIERLLNIAQHTGLRVATGGRARAVLYGLVPASTLDFLDRNFHISLPPAGMALDDSVVATAWSLNFNITDTEWDLAYATCL